jgi:hypothetical protein
MKYNEKTMYSATIDMPLKLANLAFISTTTVKQKIKRNVWL